MLACYDALSRAITIFLLIRHELQSIDQVPTKVLAALRAL